MIGTVVQDRIYGKELVYIPAGELVWEKVAARWGYSHSYQQALPRGPVGFRVARDR